MERVRQKSLAGGVLLLSLSGILVKICGFFYKVPLNAVLGDEMANINASYAVYTMLYTLSTAGIPTGIAVLMSEARVRGAGEELSVFKTARSLLAVVGFLGTAALLLMAYPVAQWNSDGDAYFCLLAIAPALFFVCLSSVYRGAFQGSRIMAPIAVSELTEALGKMGLGLLLAFLAREQWGLSDRVSAALSVLGITLGIAFGTLFLSGYAKRTFPTVEREQSNGTMRRQLLAISLPIMVASFMMNLSSLVDSQMMRPLLTAFSGDAAWAKTMYADYSTGAVTLYNLPTVLIYPITCAAVPVLAERLARGDQKGGRQVMENAFRTASLLSLPCAAVLMVLGEPILSLLFRSDPQMAKQTGYLLTLLSPAVFLAAMLTVSNAVLQACRLQKKPMLSILLGLCAKIASSLLLIPRFGAVGAPVGTVLFFVTVVGCNLYWILRYVGYAPHVGRLLLRPLGAALACAGASLAMQRLLVSSMGDLALLPALAVGGCVWLLTVLALRCVNQQDVALLPGGARLSAALVRFRLLR